MIKLKQKEDDLQYIIQKIFMKGGRNFMSAYCSESMIQEDYLDTKFRIIWEVFALYVPLLNSLVPCARHCFQMEALSGTWDAEGKGVSCSPA